MRTPPPDSLCGQVDLGLHPVQNRDDARADGVDRVYHEPATLTAHHDCAFREVLDRVGDKWTLLVIAMLEERPTQRARFSELKRAVPGISQRMLTATLRSLERDGLVTREVYPEVPPRVEYELTPLGREFMQPVRGLVGWLQSRWTSIKTAREKFDRGMERRKAS